MTKTEENWVAVARRARFACRPAAKPLENSATTLTPSGKRCRIWKWRRKPLCQRIRRKDKIAGTGFWG